MNTDKPASGLSAEIAGVFSSDNEEFDRFMPEGVKDLTQIRQC